MKNKCFFIICLISLTLLGCRNITTSKADHIEFLEIPIEGKVDDFGEKLSAQGYRFYTEDKTYHTLVFDGSYRNKYASIILDFDEHNLIVGNGTFRLESFSNTAFRMNWFVVE